MTPEQKRKGAFEQFDQLLYEGMAVPKATRIAAKGNDLRPEDFGVFAEGHLGDLETYREKMMLRAENDLVDALARDEIAKCRRREGPYKCVGGFFEGAEEAIASQIASKRGKPLTYAQTLMIEDMWDETWSPETKPTMKCIREWQRLGK